MSLLGNWKCPDKGNTITYMEFKNISDDRLQELSPGIQKISDKGYLVSRMDSKGELTSQSFIFLVKTGKNNFPDYYPSEIPSQNNLIKMYKDHFIEITIGHIKLIAKTAFSIYI